MKLHTLVLEMNCLYNGSTFNKDCEIGEVENSNKMCESVKSVLGYCVVIARAQDCFRKGSQISNSAHERKTQNQNTLQELELQGTKFAMVSSSLNIHRINKQFAKDLSIFQASEQVALQRSHRVSDWKLVMKGWWFELQRWSTYTQLQCCFQANSTC